MDNEIELDIVYQTYVPCSGLKPYIVIEAETGEVIEHEDLLTIWLLELQKYGNVVSQRSKEELRCITDKATRVTKVVPMPKGPPAIPE